MVESTQETETERPDPPRRGVAAFVTLLVLYYVAYSLIFAQRLSEYFRDLVRHFEFFRRWP
jgi:hypothetical protein